MSSQFDVWYDHSLLQMAADSYLDDMALSDEAELRRRLKTGNNDIRPTVTVNGVVGQPNQLLTSGSLYAAARPESDILPGATRMTDTQVDYFLERFEIKDHKKNDITGFSSTLFRDKESGRYILSFRSTEFATQTFGGDKSRDNWGANRDIALHGFAFAQIKAMEDYYRELRAPGGRLAAGEPIDVTGYSLGGHLATIFTELHVADINRTYVFNAAGRGRSAVPLPSLIDAYNSLMMNPDAVIPGAETGMLGALAADLLSAARSERNPYAPGVTTFSDSVYDTSRHRWAMHVLNQVTTGNVEIGIDGNAVPHIDEAVELKIDYLYGMGSHDDATATAKSGITPSNQFQILIEDQPDAYGYGSPSGEPRDFLRTHSITLLNDSLALMRTMKFASPDITQRQIESVLAAASNQRSSASRDARATLSEGDSLERVVDALYKVLLPDLAFASLDFDRSGDGFGNLKNREAFHAKLARIRDAINSSGPAAYSIVPIGLITWVNRSVLFRFPSATVEADEATSSAVVALARQSNEEGLAYRYALKELNPFAVIGAPYTAQLRQQLALYDSTTGFGGVTEEWLADRTDMLLARIRRNVDDDGHAIRDGEPTLFESHAGGVDSVVGLPVAAAGAYVLLRNRLIASGTHIDRVEGILTNQYLRYERVRRVWFGGDEGESFQGTSLNDRAYGGDGDDRLAGGSGSDYLQGDAGSDHLVGGAGDDELVGGKDGDSSAGGAGQDTYHIRRGDGEDHIIDFTGDGYRGDGQGRILFLGVDLTGNKTALDPSSPTQVWTDEAFRYELVGNQSGAGRSILRITKQGEVDAVNVLGFRSGDLGITLATLPALQKVQKLGSVQNDDLVADGTMQQVHGLDGNDHIALAFAHAEGVGGAGNDFISDSFDGTSQKLVGDSGSDYLMASAGADELYGGDDADLLVGGLDGDFLEGGAGDDVLDGGAGADVIEGGAGHDFITGGGDLHLASPWDANLPPTFGALVSGDSPTGVQGVAGLLEAVGDGADVIDGGAGRDTVFAGSDADFVSGGDDDDFLVGQAHGDTMLGDAGNDVLFGDGTEGSVVLLGPQSFVYYTLPHAHGNDVLFGGAGNDTIVGDGGADELYGDDDDDLLIGDDSQLAIEYHGDDYLDGGNGADTLYGYGGNDQLFGGNGDDTIQGDASTVPGDRKGDDYLDGGEGVDTLTGDGGDDILYGGAGDDSLFGDADNTPTSADGSDYLDGESGNDYLRGHGGDDVLLGGDGDDQLLGDGDGSRTGEEGDDLLIGGLGNDLMDGGRGDDRYELNNGDGVDKIFDSEGVNTIVFGEGISASGIVVSQGTDESGAAFLVIQYSATDAVGVRNGLVGGIQRYEFADGTVWSPAELQRRFGAGIAQHVQGTSANDELIGTGFAEIIGGGLGDDTYLFEQNSGPDTLVDAGGIDKIRFGVGITQSDVSFARSASGDLVLGLADGARITVAQHYLGPDSRLERIEFADGTVVETDSLDALPAAPLAGSIGDDVLIGSAAGEVIVGEEGRDVLRGTAGADSYVFVRGHGADTVEDGDTSGDTTSVDRIQLRGFDQSEVLVSRDVSGTLRITSLVSDDSIALPNFYASTNRIELIEFFVDSVSTTPTATITLADLEALPTDPVMGDVGDDTLTGSDQDDEIYGGGGNDSVAAGAGNDLISGGTGNDVLDGGLGSDHYRFEGGFGQDRILEVDDGSNAEDLVFFEASISPGDVAISRSSADLVLSVNGADSLTVSNYFADSSSVVERFVFADGTVWTDATIAEAVSSATAGNDSLIGTAGNDVLSGLSGDDTLYGRAGNDRLYGGTGIDLLYGEAGHDTLDGGVGDDWLFGGVGADTYIFAPGYGRDTINESFDPASSIDVLQMGPGILPSDISLTRQLSALDTVEFNLSGGADGIVANGFFFGEGIGIGAIEQIRFENGTIWDLAAIQARALLSSDDDDVLVGYASNDLITGGEGNDYIQGNGGDDSLDAGDGADIVGGGEGDDLLIGGAGSDTLSGGQGNDIYRFEADWGVDELNNADASPSTTDTILFGAGISPAFIELVRTGSNYQDLWISSGEVINPNLVKIPGYFVAAHSGAVDEIRFVDSPGTIWTNDAVRSMLLTATNGDDTLIGYDTPDVIDGLGGNDYLLGQGGSDSLLGNAGNDQLRGEAGDDQLDGGGGDDKLYGNAGDDVLIGGAGNDELRGEEFSAALEAQGADVLDGGAGNDILAGMGGDDTYRFGRGDGHDVIDGLFVSDGIDTLRFKPGVLPTAVSLFRHGDDLVASIAGDQAEVWVTRYYALTEKPIERIEFEDGTVWDAVTIATRVVAGAQDSMAGTAGDDTFVVDHVGDTITETANAGTDLVRSSVSYSLPTNVENLTLTGTLDLNATGNSLNNTLSGNSGDNRLEGLGGSDTLIGGMGDDTYVVSPGNGADAIVEIAGEGTDTSITDFSYALADNVENLIVDSGYLFDISVTGNALDNVIIETFRGGSSAIDGGAGADTMIGYSSRPTVYVVDNVADVVQEESFFGGAGSLDTVRSTVSFTLSSNIEDLVLLGTSPIAATGNGLHNRIDGSQNVAANTLIGGLGNDTYIVGAGDMIVEQPDAGTDTVEIAAGGAITFDLNAFANVEAARLSNAVGAASVVGTSGADVIEGNAFDNEISGGTGDDNLQGHGGRDVLDGGAGNDQLRNADGSISGDADTYVFGRGYGQDTITDWDHYQNFDVLRFNPDVRAVDLTLSRATSDLGAGFDNLVVGIAGVSDQVAIQYHYYQRTPPQPGASEYSYRIEQFEFADGTVWDAAAIETRRLNGSTNTFTEAADVIDGSLLSDTLNAAGGDDVVSGAQGDDTLSGGTGNDVLFGNEGADVLRGDEGDDQLFGNLDGDTLDGGLGNDQLFGHSGDDTLEGDAGSDVLEGGDGADRLFGGADGDTLRGGSGNDFLDGGAGDDALEGGGGDDTYQFGRGAGFDRVTESVSGEDDAIVLAAGVLATDVTVSRSFDDLVIRINDTGDEIAVSDFFFDVGSEIQRLVFADGTVWSAAMLRQRAMVITGTSGADALTGTAAHDAINGLAGDDTIDGLGGDDTIEGGTGNDTMRGGTGDDLYIVDSTSDIVTENPGAGTDTVQSSVTWTLGSNVEHLTLTGSASINGTGNSLANTLIGNAGHNVLNGGTGADQMRGGAGNDIYTVDNVGDVVVENANEGTDSVRASVTYTLSADVEDITLTGSGAINATGNALNNTFTGNSAANQFSGGLGDDIYVIGSTDTVVENAGAGTDQVRIGSTYTLGVHVEALLLTGTTAINGTGNALNNLITGNSANNTLSGGSGTNGNDILQGMAGNDRLSDTSGRNLFDGGTGTDTITGGAANEFFAGGAGNDTITTGNGADIIVFNRNNGQDTVNASTGADNTLSIGGGVTYDDMKFAKSGNNLVLKLGGTDQITLRDWYLSSTNKSVLNLQVVAEAMAGFNPASSDPLYNTKVTVFNFLNLATVFDQALAQAPGLTDWALTNALASFQTGGSDTQALGGDLSYWYGRNGNLSGVGYQPAHDILSSANFGSGQQALQSVPSLQAGAVRLG